MPKNASTSISIIYMQSTRSCHLAAVWVGGRHWSIMFFERVLRSSLGKSGLKKVMLGLGMPTVLFFWWPFETCQTGLDEHSKCTTMSERFNDWASMHICLGHLHGFLHLCHDLLHLGGDSGSTPAENASNFSWLWRVSGCFGPSTSILMVNTLWDCSRASLYLPTSYNMEARTSWDLSLLGCLGPRSSDCTAITSSVSLTASSSWPSALKTRASWPRDFSVWTCRRPRISRCVATTPCINSNASLSFPRSQNVKARFLWNASVFKCFNPKTSLLTVTTCCFKRQASSCFPNSAKV